jgi:hypothetical protein
VSVVNPGKIATKAHVEGFSLRVQRDLEDNLEDAAKFKLVARSGTEMQEVVLVLKAGLRLELDEVQELVDNAVDRPRGESSTSHAYDDLPGEGRLNKSGAEVKEQQSKQSKSKSKEKDDEMKAKQKEKKMEQLEAEKKKKLQSSGAARESGLSIDAHAKNWAEMESGEKSTGKHFGGGRTKREFSQQPRTSD